MRILLLSNMYPSSTQPSYGVFVKNFVEQLSAKTMYIDKVVISGRGKNIFEKLIKYLHFLLSSVRLLVKCNYDLIYIHGAGLSLLPLYLVSWKKPLVVNIHGTDVLSDTFWGRRIRSVFSRIVKKADLVVVPSDFFMNIVSETLQVERQKLFISASGGVNTSFFKPPAIKMQKKEVVFGYVSRIDNHKGWNVFLEACERLAKEGIYKFEVLFVGGGAQLEELKGDVEKLYLTDRVRVLGPVQHESLVEYFQQMDVFVFPTMLQESLGLVGLEAMACGVPVIGSDIGGLRSYISPNMNGYLFSPGSVEDLTAKMRMFMDLGASEKSRLGINARNTAELYSGELVASSLIDKMREICLVQQIV